MLYYGARKAAVVSRRACRVRSPWGRQPHVLRQGKRAPWSCAQRRACLPGLLMSVANRRQLPDNRRQLPDNRRQLPANRRRLPANGGVSGQRLMVRQQTLAASSQVPGREAGLFGGKVICCRRAVAVLQEGRKGAAGSALVCCRSPSAGSQVPTAVSRPPIVDSNWLSAAGERADALGCVCSLFFYLEIALTGPFTFARVMAQTPAASLPSSRKRPRGLGGAVGSALDRHTTAVHTRIQQCALARSEGPSIFATTTTSSVERAKLSNIPARDDAASSFPTEGTPPPPFLTHGGSGRGNHTF